MKLRAKGWLLFILAFVVFVGVNEDSYAKSKKRAKQQVAEYEEYGDVGVYADKPQFVAHSEIEYRWAQNKTKAEILEKAKKQLQRGDKDVKIFLINGVTFADAEQMGNSTNIGYIGWGIMTHNRKNGEEVEFYYYEKNIY